MTAVDSEKTEMSHQQTSPNNNSKRPIPYTTHNNPITGSVQHRRPFPDYSNYEDAIAQYDCTPFLQRFGLLSRRSRYQKPDSTAGHIWFVKDVCGVVCAVFTWLLIFYAEYVVMFVVLLPSQHFYHSIINAVIFQVFAILAICSHTKAMLTDPVGFIG